MKNWGVFILAFCFWLLASAHFLLTSPFFLLPTSYFRLLSTVIGHRSSLFKPHYKIVRARAHPLGLG